MIKDKSKLTTIGLLIMTFFLLGAIVYISFLLTSGSGERSKIAPIKTKAANITYSKLVALNPTGTEVVSPQEQISTVPTPTVEEEINEVTITPTDVENSPTPTEIILAYSTSEPKEATEDSQILTVTPTKVKDLPDAGFIYNGLIIFSAAILLVFFSFLF